MVVGTYLLGIIVNTFLFGFGVLSILDIQDHQTIIGALFCIDLLHSVVETYGAWQMCVTNYANPGSLQFVSWVIPFTAAATAVAALLAQIFLGHRVLLLTKSIFLVLVIGF
ncbi:hypothetical protein MPER_11570 [Moniliophthora perniciosa FA553]|nr:hypothetical protein MPER_11570 [Moniliophthora perniciosa FA553]